MKNRKRDFILIIAGIIFVVLVIYIGVNLLPKNRMIKEITNILKPVLKSENQSIHLDAATAIGENVMQMDADFYTVKEDGRQYFIVESQNFPIYITDNILLFKNGKAFKITDEETNVKVDYKKMLSQISMLYKVLDITCEKSAYEKGYYVEVTDDKMTELLAMLPIEKEMEEHIEKLQLKLVSKDKQLERIEFVGSADTEEKQIELTVLLSEFKILKKGEYKIPDLVRASAEAVDEDSLFSLSEDLYRLMTAAKKMSQEGNIEGTVYISANCGTLKISNRSTLKELQKNSGNSDISINIESISDIITLLCLEGDISCSEQGEEYSYHLQLSKEAMQTLTERLVPEIVNYVVTFTNGSATIVLKEENISSVEIEIGGSVNILSVDIPANVSAKIQLS